MKPTITPRERDRIDAWRALADTLRLAMLQLTEQVHAELGIDDWDHKARAAVSAYVFGGGEKPIEKLLEELGVNVHEVLADGDGPSGRQ